MPNLGHLWGTANLWYGDLSPGMQRIFNLGT